MNNILVSGYIGYANFGDEAIFYALSKKLKSLGLNVGVLCANKREVSRTYLVETYANKNILEILRAIIKSDILISGGGSLLQNKTSNLSLYYYLFIILLAKLFKKKVIIFAQGIEQIKGKINELFTKFVLKKADFISVRDARSKLYLSKNMHINSTLLSDPVYSLIDDVEICENKYGLIVQLRNCKGMDDAFIQKLALNISKYYKNEVKILPLQNEYDYEICKKFKDEIEKYDINVQLLSNKSIDEVIEIINNAKYVISTRFHSTLVANGLKSKVFSLVYDDKVKTLCEELNIENINLLKYTDNEFLNKFDIFFNSFNLAKIDYRRFEWKCIEDAIREELKFEK